MLVGCEDATCPDCAGNRSWMRALAERKLRAIEDGTIHRCCRPGIEDLRKLEASAGRELLTDFNPPKPSPDDLTFKSWLEYLTTETSKQFLLTREQLGLPEENKFNRFSAVAEEIERIE